MSTIADCSTMLWTEIYRGIPGRPRSKLVNAGWCCLAKSVGVADIQTIASHFHAHGYPANKYCVLFYPESHCSQKYRPTDPILGNYV